VAARRTRATGGTQRSNGQFKKRFRLPEDAKVDQVKAGL
jgi:HSP20 family molecular chaperone IbpA